MSFQQAESYKTQDFMFGQDDFQGFNGKWIHYKRNVKSSQMRFVFIGIICLLLTKNDQHYEKFNTSHIQYNQGLILHRQNLD